MGFEFVDVEDFVSPSRESGFPPSCALHVANNPKASFLSSGSNEKLDCRTDEEAGGLNVGGVMTGD